MNLKSIILLYPVGSSVLQCIANCKQLETLECCIATSATLLDLSNLGQLRELQISNNYQNIMTTAFGFENLQFLEQLTLNMARVDSKFFRLLSQLKQLKVLKLTEHQGLHNLNQIGDLNQLTTLEIHSFRKDADLNIVPLVECMSKLNCLTVAVPGYEMDLEKYLRIVNAVRRRPDRSKLMFRLIYSDFNYDHLVSDFARNAHLVEMIIYSPV